MKFFSLPADFKKETIDQYHKLNMQYRDSKVVETYGQITIGNTIGSGRASDLIPKIDMSMLEKYVEYSKSKNIGFNYTLNATCLGNAEFTVEGMKKIDKFLDELYDIGIDSITVALIPLIEYIRLVKPHFKVRVSTLSEITNTNKAVSFSKLGTERIVLDESINRDFDTLKSITGSVNSEVEIIVNVICHKNCIYRMFHSNQASHDNLIGNQSVTYYSHRCMLKRIEEVGNLMRMNWVRPEDLKYYSQIGIKYFKIQGRQAVHNGDPVRVAESYMKEYYDGNLMELLDCFSPTNAFQIHMDNRKLDGFIKPYIENPNFCKNDCTRCNYCDKYALNSVNCNEAKKVFSHAKEFYAQYDQFNNLIKRVVEEKMDYQREQLNNKALFEEFEKNIDFNCNE